MADSGRWVTKSLTGWGRTTRSSASFVVMHDEDEIAALIQRAPDRGVLARGLGRSYGDSAQNAGGIVLAPFRPDSAPEVDVGSATATLTAGVSLGRLLEATLPYGLVPPVLPGTRHVSIGGAIANDVHGKNHHVDGSIGGWIDRIEMIDGTGERRILGPTRDAEAFWATVGGMGLTGVITRATLRLRPVETSYVRVRTRRIADFDQLLDSMREETTTQYQVAWVDCFTRGRSLLDDAIHATVADLPPRSQRNPRTYRPGRPLVAPALPGSPLRPSLVKAFNEVWWRRAPVDAERMVPFGRFFHPLDGVADWHRLYGAGGFLQYQLVVPDGAEHLLRRFVDELPAAGAPPFLVVLKRFGDSSPAPLSFPARGWTLAPDLPAHAGLAPLLDKLDAEVAGVGGRVYLAKDARMRAGVLAAM